MVSENYGAGPETWARALQMCSSDLGNAEASFEDACELIAALEAENQALREFVAANDKHESFRETVPTDGYELWIAEWEHLKREAWKARQRLATEFGLPLPEVER